MKTTPRRLRRAIAAGKRVPVCRKCMGTTPCRRHGARLGEKPMTLKITDARAAELAALDVMRDGLRHVGDAATDAPPALLADRRVLLDALRRAVDAADCDSPPDGGYVGTRFGSLDEDDPLVLAMRDLRALLASAEGERE